MPFEFAKLTSAEIEKLSSEKTVFFFPVSGLEDHGPHLPVGIDLEESRALCRMAAEKLERDVQGWTGVIMPDAPMAVQLKTKKLALSMRGFIVRDYLVDSCRALIRAGFKNFVCFTSSEGPRQLTAIEEAGKIISRPLLRYIRKGPVLVSACSGRGSFKEAMKSPFKNSAPEHGGKRDTSVALKLGARVDPIYMGLPERERPSSPLIGEKISGYWGDPHQASAETGEKILQNQIDEIFPKLRAVWEGANPNMLFRSWYSILPPNQSFFKAWLLILTFFGFMGAWVYLVLTTVIHR